MEYAVVVVPAAPLRRKPDHRREMVSQLLFGESVQVTRSKGNGWLKVRSLHDNYEGWTTDSLLQLTDEATAGTPSLFATSAILDSISLDQKKIHIPAGSSLPFFSDQIGGKGKIAGMGYHFSGNYINRFTQKPSPDILKELSTPWLNAPYLWGGRTPLGVDCSGFVQVIYKLMGFDLSRDAWQQAVEGRGVKKFRESLPGDLAFFCRKRTISHVGILLGEGKIIHCSGRVKIDQVDKKGLIDAATGERKLSLHCVRRIW